MRDVNGVCLARTDAALAVYPGRQEDHLHAKDVPQAVIGRGEHGGEGELALAQDCVRLILSA